MRIARVDVSQRYRGRTDVVSSTARILTRVGEAVVIALVALSCLATWAAPAAADAHTDDLAPQPSPVAQGSHTPTPDPAPQADTHTSTPPTSSIHVTTRTTVGAPTQPLSSRVLRTSQTSAPSAATDTTAHHVAPPPRFRSHAAVHPVRAAQNQSARVGLLPFPLALPRDLLVLPRAGAPAPRNGLLLLLSSVAMAVVAVAASVLLRRLRGLASA